MQLKADDDDKIFRLVCFTLCTLHLHTVSWTEVEGMFVFSFSRGKSIRYSITESVPLPALPWTNHLFDVLPGDHEHSWQFMEGNARRTRWFCVDDVSAINATPLNSAENIQMTSRHMERLRCRKVLRSMQMVRSVGGNPPKLNNGFCQPNSVCADLEGLQCHSVKVCKRYELRRCLLMQTTTR